MTQNYEVRTNQWGATDIHFNERPSKQVIDLLKSNGFRWFGKTESWSSFKVKPEEVEKLLNGEQVEITTDDVKIESVFDKQAFENVAKNYWDEQFFRKTYYGVLKLDDVILSFEKPRIETRFCYGYGCYGVSDSESENDASDMAHEMRNNQQLFIDENLKDLNKTIKELNEVLNCELNKIVFYKNENKDTNYYRFAKKYSGTDTRIYDSYWHDITNEIYRIATDDEIRTMIKAYEEIKQSFVKRLNTYLKKYGLSKIDVWTYLRD